MTEAIVPPARVGFVGLGRMGLPMAGRLGAAGYAVRCHDSRAPAMEALADAGGAEPCASAAETARGAACVILMLPGSDAVDPVAGELLEAAAAGTLVIDMSSSNPTSTRALEPRFRERGIALVDAPVSGGVRGAEAGTLAIMAGGREGDIERCRPLFEHLGGSIRHAGPVGSGHAIKAINNLLSATHLISSVEAIALARRFDLDPARVLAIVNESSGRSGSTEDKIERFVLSESFDAGFTTGLMAKDIATAISIAEETGFEMPLGREVARLWSEIGGYLGDDADFTEVARWVEGRQR